jgi:hypothetical protein
MSPEKDKIALVVQSSDLSSLKLWNMGKQRREHPSDRVTKTGTKVVKNQLRFVRGCASMSLNILAERDRAQLEVCSGSIRQVNQCQSICEKEYS